MTPYKDMYEIFYRFEAEPFRLSPDTRFCFDHKSYARAKAYMQYAFNRAEGFVMVTGRPGTGKTTLIGDLVNSLPRSRVTVATLVTTQLEAEDMLEMLAHALGVGTSGRSKAATLQSITIMLRREHEKGRRALLIIDEAQDLSVSALEELRLLTNLQRNGRPLLQIFLVGQDQLRDLVHAPEMEQVFQRIVAACHLDPLTQEETREYVRHRLRQSGWRGDPRLSESLYPIIHRFSEGIPRRINLICGRLLLHGAVERKHELGVADARLVVGELHAERLTSLSPTADNIFDQPDHFEEEEFPPPSKPSARAESELDTGDRSLGQPSSEAAQKPMTLSGENAAVGTVGERQPEGKESPAPQEAALQKNALPTAASETKPQAVRAPEPEAPFFPLPEETAPDEEGPSTGHSWLWWLGLLIILTAGLGWAWYQGLLG